jgi:hypothetical protein
LRTGGAFYNPPSQANSPFPDGYLGDYFFADFCGGWIARHDIATDTATGFASGAGEFPVDLKVGSEGDLFFLARATGSVENTLHSVGTRGTATLGDETPMPLGDSYDRASEPHKAVHLPDAGEPVVPAW